LKRQYLLRFPALLRPEIPSRLAPDSISGLLHTTELSQFCEEISINVLPGNTGQTGNSPFFLSFSQMIPEGIPLGKGPKLSPANILSVPEATHFVKLSACADSKWSKSVISEPLRYR